MRTRTFVIIGAFLVLAGLASFGWWVVSLALSLPDKEMKLSLFVPHAGGCAWYQADIDGKGEREVTRFTADCSRVTVTFSLGGDAALVWFPDDTLAPQDELVYLVDLRERKARRLPSAEPGEPMQYVFSAEGSVVAFTENQQINMEPPDVLVQALELRGDQWRPLETKPSRCCSEGAPSIRELDMYQALRRDPRVAERQSAELLTMPVRFDPLDPASAAVRGLKALHGEAHAPTDAPYYEMLRKTWKEQLVFRATRTGDALATGVAGLSSASGVRRIPGFAFKPNDVLQLQASGRYLLVTEWGSGMQPHVYDMQTGQLLFTSPVAIGATFWPQPAGSPDK